MNSTPKQVVRASLGFAMALSILAQGCSVKPQTTKTPEAIQRGFGLPDEELNGIPVDSFVKLERTIYRRASPASIPVDPRHAKESDTVTETNWLLKGGIVGGSPIRFEQRDGKTGQLRSMTLIVDNKMQIHDLMTGQSRVMDFDRTPQVDKLPKRGSEKLHISQLATSDWAKPAWLVTEQIEPTEETMRQTSAYIADLAIAQLERRWIVDQSVNQLIKFEVVAKAANGDVVVLESTTAAPPFYGKITDLPTGWFDLASRSHLRK